MSDICAGTLIYLERFMYVQTSSVGKITTVGAFVEYVDRGRRVIFKPWTARKEKQFVENKCATIIYFKSPCGPMRNSS